MNLLMLVIVIFSFLVTKGEASEKSPIRGTTEFELAAQSPLRITFCNNQLVSFNRSKQSLDFFDLGEKTLKFQTPLKISPQERLTALSCFKSRPLAIIRNFKTKTNRLVGSQLVFPLNEQVLDFKCNNSICVALFPERIFELRGTKNWKEIQSIPTHRIEPAKDKSEENPFFRWQDKLVITEGLQSRAFTMSRDRFGFVDPFSAAVIIQTGSHANKISQWGVWGGRLLAPKAAAVSPMGIILVLDSSLKSIFAFTESGEYWGAMQINGEVPSLDYPTDLLTAGSLLVVSDFRGNKIWGFRLDPFLPNAPSSGLEFRQNFFRRDAVLKDRQLGKCMICHDGTVRDDWDHLLPLTGYHHSTDKKDVSCTSCHNPHHGAVPLPGTKLKKGNIQEKPPFLIDSPRKLCHSCHQEQSAESTNHPHKDSDGSCLGCHTPHKAVSPALLKKHEAGLCISCHSSRGFRHPEVSNFSDVDRAKKFKLLDGGISCTSCHSVHGRSRTEAILKPDEPLLNFCSSCHGSKSPKLFNEFHRRAKK
ncbi:MAG: cytochrome c3 family protein [Oligoflexia bacterium]|nr:cytochrome c3 family protein [Oligoflexia bacterium]